MAQPLGCALEHKLKKKIYILVYKNAKKLPKKLEGTKMDSNMYKHLVI